MSDKPAAAIALVTGASSGIGAEFCRQLADRCERIIATGRRAEALESLAGELASRCEVISLPADLATLEGRTRVIECLRQRGPVDYLVNNAGFGTLGHFDSLDLDTHQAMVRVHIDATLALCRAAIPFMKQRGGGYIVNVSSTASFEAIAGACVYVASKAFLNAFSESLQAELRDAGIRVQCLCPGFTVTGFHDSESMAPFDRTRVPDALWMDAADVVRASIDALARDAVIVVPGRHNRDGARAALQSRLDATTAGQA